MNFQELGLSAPILSALEAQGYRRPTPIQEGAIPPALAGRDVLGIAQTGTGKTCAFATPILQRLSAQSPKGPRVIRSLILTPTRELALQIQESFENYGANLPLRSAVIFGGVGQQPQVDKLRRGLDILVATPGRLLDLQGQGLLDLSHIQIFVLDEADRMLDMGFIHDVRRVLKLLPQRKQTLFFSATMPPEVQGLVDELLRDPARVAVTPVSSPVEIIAQSLYFVDKNNKTKLLAYLVDRPEVKNALVFSRTKHGANKVAGDLTKAGVSAAAIHGNKSQTARQQALADFKAGRIKVLVATDIAARGIDIEELSHVFNYNLPDVPETYVHRIGRTGRAGHGGVAISFCDISEKEDLKGIEKLLGKPIPKVEDHPWPMENFEPPKRDKNGKIVNPEDAEARQAARERKAQREGRRPEPDGPARGQAPRRGASRRALPEVEGSRSVSAADPGAAAPQKPSSRGNSSRVQAGSSQGPAKVQPGSGQGPVRVQPESSQSPARVQARVQPGSGQGPAKVQAKAAPGAVTSARKSVRDRTPGQKRQAAGYKPSKTLDDALRAMAPKSSNPLSPKGPSDSRGDAPARDPAVDEAFARWMEEERRIQAQKGYTDPLAGEEIMDATARLLAPKREGRRAGPDGPARGQEPRRGPSRRVLPEAEGSRAVSASSPSVTAPKREGRRAGPDGPARGQEPRRGAGRGKALPPKGSGSSGSASGGGGEAGTGRRKKPAGAQPAQGSKAPSSQGSELETKRTGIRGQAKTRAGGRTQRGRRPIEPTLRPSTQKDSTEHASLMKPYYLSDD